MARKRSYPYQDGDTAIACRLAVENIKNNLDALSQVDTSLTNPYLNNLKDQCLQAMVMLGMNPEEGMLDATLTLNNMIEPALEDLKIIKQMLKVKFDKEETGQILNKLGYPKYYKRAVNRDQEELIKMHFAFSQGMSETLKTRITATGINPVIIDRIIARTEVLYEANVRQEEAKVTARAMNNETIDFCNQLYEEVIGLCKIAYSFYSKDPEKRNQFSFTRLVKNLNARSGKPKGEEEEPAAE